MDSLVSIIIPHWNGIDVLSECLDSLKQTDYPNFEIIVVDNASTDGSGDWINDHHPRIKLIKNDQNYGYSGGCNRGMPCLLYTSPSPRDLSTSRMPSSA